MPRKTRRSKRHQRGGVPRWQILLGALSLIPKVSSQTLGDAVSKWWNEGGWENSKNLAERLLNQGSTDTKVTELAKSTQPTESIAEYAPPPHTDANETVVEPYLPEARLKDLKSDGSVYKYEDTEFTVDTWTNKGDRATISTQDGKTVDVPMDAKFKVISEPPKKIEEEEDDEDYDGGRRRKSRKQRRKTLRRKK